MTAGLSLGEYTALYAAEVLSFEDALILVQKRGQAMQAAADATEGAMVSIIGLDENKVNDLCAEASDGELLVAIMIVMHHYVPEYRSPTDLNHRFWLYFGFFRES